MRTMPLLWIGLAVACAAPNARTLSNPARDEQPGPEEARPKLVLVPRPHVDIATYLPDFHDELRWPLKAMQHPVLEPSFAIADQFAQPGVRWTDLCQVGAQNRSGQNRELTAYLRGWCKVLAGDVDAACANLVPLTGSTIAGLDDAVRADLANILVNDGHADKAEHWINKHRIRDIGLLDVLSASYVEVGTPGDALAIAQLAIESDDAATAATRCTRWTRAMVLSNGTQDPMLLQIRELAMPRDRAGDPECLRLLHKLHCWSGETSCADYFDDENTPSEVARLVEAYQFWPYRSYTIDAWEHAAMTATGGAPLPGASDLAVSACENAFAVSSSGCTRDLQALLSYVTPRIKPSLDQRPDLAKRVAAMNATCSP